MRKISRASDSIWHTASPDWDAEYAELQARKATHRSDAEQLSHADLHNAYDDLGDDIELDKHNEYPFFDHFFSNIGQSAQMPEKTEAQKAHDDLKMRRDAFGDELDERGLWGPKAETERQKLVQRMNDWPKNYAYREGLIQRGILEPHESYSGDNGFDKYMGEGGFSLQRANAIGDNYSNEGKRRADRQMTKLFGSGGFDPKNPEHLAIRKQIFDEHAGR